MRPKTRELAEVIQLPVGRRRSKVSRRAPKKDGRFEMRAPSPEIERWTHVALQRGYLSVSDWTRDVLNRAAKLQALTSSDDETANTPPIVIEAISPLGAIGLDPCSNEGSIVPARRTYTLPAQDGLRLSWRVREGEIVYVNPPYGDELPKWVRKCIAEAKRGRTIVLLVPNRPDTKWFDAARRSAQARADWRGRLKFLGKGSAPFPSAVFYWGPHAGAFESALSPHAHVELAA